jgi:uncharacterized protein (TIGR02145 family)
MMDLLFTQPLFKIFKMKKYIVTLIIMMTFSVLVFGQVVPQGYLVNPPDQTVTIGTQVWMKYNLAVTTYQNGDPIEGADTQFNRTSTTPAWCYYNHDASNNAIYGKLYNGYVVNDTRNICPVGFRVPTQNDFNTLATFIGGNANGGKLKETGISHWTSPNTSATNTTGFTGLPGGYMGNANSSSNLNDQGYFWTSTPISGGGSTNYIRYLIYTSGTFTEATTFVLGGGVSVRCIKN